VQALSQILFGCSLGLAQVVVQMKFQAFGDALHHPVSQQFAHVVAIEEHGLDLNVAPLRRGIERCRAVARPGVFNLQLDVVDGYGALHDQAAIAFCWLADAELAFALDVGEP